MNNYIPYFVLEKTFINHDNSTVIYCLLNILNNYYNNKIPINNNDIIKDINNIIKKFPKISLDEWINYFIKFLKNNINKNQWNFIIEFTNTSVKNTNIIFQNNHVTICHDDNTIQLIYTNKNLIEGSKYFYNNHIINQSLQYRLNNLKKNLLLNIQEDY
jgi:hypothetical protein